MSPRHSLVTRLALVITACSLLILSGMLAYNYHQSRSLLEQELAETAHNLATSLVHRLESEFRGVAKVTSGIALAMEHSRPTGQTMHELLRETVRTNPEIYGSAIAFEPFAYHEELERYAPYYFRQGEAIAYQDLNLAYSHIPYLYWDWYQIPRELEQLEWSEPYFDDGAGNVLMSTCSVPFYDRSGDEAMLRGIVTADLSLEALTELVSSTQILETGYAALLSRNGTLLAHPDSRLIMNESIFSIAAERQAPQLREIGRRMVAGESDFVYTDMLSGEASWLYFMPIPSTGWTLLVVFPEDELLHNIRVLSISIAGLGILGLLLLVVTIVQVTSSMLRPLAALTAATDEIAAGNFDVVLPETRYQDEIGALSRDFQQMRDSLKEYIHNLTETTAAKERIQSELKVATRIQEGLLPKVFPAFPNHPEFDIYATMVPAKEVGGDFYDFFFVEENRLCFLIADVSDKGVPAALYMMVTKTLLKSEGMRLKAPEQMLAAVNNILAQDNENCMFTTVFCAILDVQTGRVSYCNAGHNPPVHIRQADGVAFVSSEPNLMIGPMEDIEYHSQAITLSPGDVMFLYTDGVTEASDLQDRLYGEQRLLDILGAQQSDDIVALIETVQQDLSRHAEGAAQSDDITMLALRFGCAGQTSG